MELINFIQMRAEPADGFIALRVRLVRFNVQPSDQRRGQLLDNPVGTELIRNLLNRITKEPVRSVCPKHKTRFCNRLALTHSRTEAIDIIYLVDFRIQQMQHCEVITLVMEQGGSREQQQPWCR